MASLLSRRQAYGNERFLALPVWIQHGAGWERREALVDSGASLNFISHLLAKELELAADPAPLKRVTTLGGQTLLTYGFRKATLRLEDTQGRRIERAETLVAADITGYDLILGYPWLQGNDPDIRWKDGSWRLRSRSGADSAPVELSTPEDFLQVATEENAIIYGAWIAQDGSPSATILDATGLRLQGAVEVQIPSEYADLAEVFSEAKANQLAAHGAQDHSIEIEGGQPPWGPLYNLSCSELATLRDYIKTNLEKGFIRPSKSSAGAPVLFVKKKDGTLRLCVDYRALNKLSKKNRYPLPLISEALDRLAGAAQYTKLDIRSAYNLIRIKEGDEWKTAFRTRYGHYKYQVMPFGLANAPATFQRYMNDALREYLDVFCIAYLDDIIIYTEKGADHALHVRKVLVKLRQHGLYVKLEKCEFSVYEVGFVGFRISPAGVSIETSRVDAILEWPEPKSFRDIQVFIGFANFYRRFICSFSAIATPLTSMLKGGKAGKFPGPFSLTAEASQAFRRLREAFTTAPVLAHFNPEMPLRVECDASMIGIAAILSQQSSEKSAQQHWHPIAYFSRKLSACEANYGVGDLEMLAIVSAFAQWRHYLGGAAYQIEVASDHHNLQTFMTTKALNGRQVRWYERLVEYDLRIIHRPGQLNPADAPSRRPDYEGSRASNSGTPNWFREAMRGRNKPAAHPRCDDSGQSTARSSIAGTGDREHLVPRRSAHIVALAETAYKESQADRSATLVGLQGEDAWLTTQLNQDAARAPGSPDASAGVRAPKNWSRDDKGIWRYKNCIYLPQSGSMRSLILRSHHDDPLAGHFGAKRTTTLIQRKYYWPRLTQDVKEYVRTCTTCPRIKAARHKPYGELQSLPVPKGPWCDLTMDFITGLPPSGRNGHAYDAILVVMDRFTKMANYIATTKRIDAVGLADLFFERIVCRYGAPNSVVSDRGTVFTAQFWSAVCYHAKIRRRLSTAFHPQTDGQTERQNQTLEQYLRSYVAYQQDNWADWLPMAEFAYNNSHHMAIGCSPFFAHMGRNPRMEFEFEERQGEVPAARRRAQRLRALRAEMTKRLEHARITQARYADRKTIPRTYGPGDMVWLSARNIHTIRPSKKLDFKNLGPFKVLEAVGAQAYRLDLTNRLVGIHNVFHVSLLEPFESREGDQTPQPRPLEVDGSNEWEIEHVLDAKTSQGQLQYLVKWVGWSDAYNEWVPARNMGNAEDAIATYHQRYPRDKEPNARRQRAKQAKTQK